MGGRVLRVVHWSVKVKSADLTETWGNGKAQYFFQNQGSYFGDKIVINKCTCNHGQNC